MPFVKSVHLPSSSFEWHRWGTLPDISILYSGNIKPMNHKPFSMLKSLSRVLVAVFLVGILFFSQTDAALAARTGGRIGGGSFRRPMPSRTYTRPPARGNARGYYPGGGLGFPFLLPFFGFGGGFGGLFSILIFIAIANFLVSSFRRASSDMGEGSMFEGYDQTAANPPVAINKIQVGLLAHARDLQRDLNRIGLAANTGSTAGLTKVLQETTLSLLRHPEYWVYASATSEQSRLAAAEAKFNHLALTERSKFQAETLSNVKQEVQQGATATLVKPEDLTQAPGEYILVTLLVASQGKLNLSKVQSDSDLRQSLNQLGAISSEQLLALEVLWTPQAEGDTLTSDDLVAAYPDLKLL